MERAGAIRPFFMMIKLNTSIASNEFSYAAGETVSLDAQTEKRLIETGQAERVVKKKAVKKHANS